MIDDAFRQRLPRLARPLIGLYRRVGATPNQVTWAGFALACASAAALAAGHDLPALALWWVSRLADGTDGILARETGQSSEFGAYLDIVLDMAAYGLVVLAFDLRHPELHARWAIILFLYVLCIASALALGALEQGRRLAARDDRGLRLGAGLAEGGETGIAYTLFLLLPGWLPWLTGVWIAVLATTVVSRTLLARRLLATPPAAPPG